jgi:hypothetical protein
MHFIAQDLSEALRTGVAVGLGQQQFVLRLAVVSVKGDWPFLIEAAHLERHFRRAPKRPDSQLCGFGICHLCCAGMPGISFTDASDSPDWEATIGSAAALTPWESWSPWQELPSLPNFRPWTFRPDIFHNFHLGHGRYFLSSALVVLQEFEEGGGVDARFEAMTRKWQAFCKSCNETWSKECCFALSQV